MSTDATIHLHVMLDRLSRSQDRLTWVQESHTAMLTEILRRQKALAAALAALKLSDTTPQTKLLSFLRPAIFSGANWAGGVLAMAYVLKGGDLVTALQTLLKLLS